MKFMLFFVALNNIVNFSNSYCFWNHPCRYKYFANKTPYEFVRGDIRDSVLKLEGCTTISLWGLIRHGKRNPDDHFAPKMLDAIFIKDYIKASYENGEGLMCTQDVENLSKWNIDPDFVMKAHHLLPEGYRDIIGIGYRLSHVFKDLLKNLSDNYTIRPAYGHWIENCAKAFIKGIGNKSMVIENSKPHYDVMAPYDACEYYTTKVKKNPDIHIEQYKYQNMTEYLKVKEGIKKRTGINLTLTDDDILSIYDLCRYTTSGISNTMSPWCALFTNEDLQVLEYIGDLRSYYRNGHGTHINQFFGRIPMGDLLESFKKARNGIGKKFVVYFTHTTMMEMVYAALGIFKDDVPLTAAFRNPKRKWRSSINSSFACNLIASLNRCTVGKRVEYNVVFYLNERPLKELCNDGVCSWRDFEKLLQPLLNTTFNFCKM